MRSSSSGSGSGSPSSLSQRRAASSRAVTRGPEDATETGQKFSTLRPQLARLPTLDSIEQASTTSSWHQHHAPGLPWLADLPLQRWAATAFAGRLRLTSATTDAARSSRQLEAAYLAPLAPALRPLTGSSAFEVASHLMLEHVSDRHVRRSCLLGANRSVPFPQSVSSSGKHSRAR